MSANNSTSEGGQEKSLPETTVQTVPQNLTTIQSVQSVQNIQCVQNASNIQGIQAAQAITGQTATLVGKSISLELNSKLLMKPSIPSNIVTSSENNKIATSTFCPVGSTVRIIAPSMLSTIERQGQSQVQQTTQQTQQIVTSLPSTYHVPRGPAAVANISAPRATVATPLVRAISTGQPIPISRPGNPATYDGPRGPSSGRIIKYVGSTRNPQAFTHSTVIDLSKTLAPTKKTCKLPRKSSKLDEPQGPIEISVKKNPLTAHDFNKQLPNFRIGVNTTVSNTQWQSKTTSVVYAQPQRHPVPVVNRPPARPAATVVYTGQPQPQPQTQQQQQQPRLVSPNQVTVGRPVRATVVTATPSRLITPVLQPPNSNITRLSAPTRPSTPQIVTSIPQVSQAGRPVSQTIQPNQTSRPLSATPINRIAVSAPVLGASNRVATVTSVQTSVGRQLTINTAAGASAGTVSRIVIPQQALQQQQQQGRLVQTVAPLTSYGPVSRVIATTTSTNAGVAGNVTRVAQTGPTSVARITGMSLHPLPLTPARATPTPLKVTAQGPGIQTVQLKQATTTMQPQSQSQQQQQQGSTLQRTIGSVNNTNVAATSVANQQPTQVQGQYLNPHHTTTYYSIEPSGVYSQYRPTTVQPVRVLVEQGFEEPLGKPNASPRPSILRKREHDNSPGKGIAKNLVPVLASLPVASSSVSSPPGSPKGERDNGGNHSSGSTTVSATSSPGLDEEPEQSRITINPTVEMSPRKKPRKQQLTGVELTESRCTEEEMQFITEEKIKKEFKEEHKEKYSDRKSNLNLQRDLKPPQQPPIKSKPTPSMIGSSWKNKYSTRLHHYKRPTDVRPREERRPTVTEISQQKHVLQKVNGWKVHHLTTQMDDLADIEKSVYEKVKSTLSSLESQQRSRQDDALERVNELLKGNMQRSNLISEGMRDARTQLTAIFHHKTYVTELLQRCSNKRTQKKRDK